MFDRSRTCRRFVSGDPLKDISVLENVELVMKEGKVYKQVGRPVSH